MNKKAADILRVFIGLMFIFSGVVKLFPIEAFELKIIYAGITNWSLVTFLSRALIAFEIFLGLSLLQRSYLKKIFIPAAVILLFVFCVQLSFNILFWGWEGDCGCFGEVIKMSPLLAIIKNIILIAALWFIFKNTGEKHNTSPVLPMFAFIFSFAIVFLSFKPLKYEIITKEMQQKKGDSSVAYNQYFTEKKNNRSPFSQFNKFSDGKIVDLTKGEKIVALLSLDCDHCIKAAKEIGELNKKIDLPPVYFLFLGEPDQLSYFFGQAGFKFPYHIIDGRTFFSMLKGYPPRIILLNNGNIAGDWNNETFSKEKLKEAAEK